MQPFIPEDYLGGEDCVLPCTAAASPTIDPFADDFLHTISALSLEWSLSPSQISEDDNEDETNVDRKDRPSIGSNEIGIPCPHSLAPAGVCTITGEEAQMIFMARWKRNPCKKDGLAICLGKQFGITAKAVRDIWCLRTWTRATWPLWKAEDFSKYLKRRLCVSCRKADVRSIDQACKVCKERVILGLAQ